MEKTQDHKNSAPLTTNTHSGTRSAGPSAPGLNLHTHMDAYKYTHTQWHNMYTELTQTPAKALAATLSLSLANYTKWCHMCDFILSAGLQANTPTFSSH